VRTLVRLSAAVLLFALAACQTASYKETSQLAGTNWKPVDQSQHKRTSFQELQFGKDLAPSGMGNVRIAPNEIVLFQVVNDKLLMKADFLEGTIHYFDFDIDGDKMTLTSLTGANGKPEGVQHFVKQ
jgi:hypothetical protein